MYPTLPQTGASNVLYLIGPTGTGADKYEEYVYANNAFTKIGDTSIDLSGYVTTQALNTALADYVTSSALSTALAGKEDTANKKTTIAGNEGDDTYYPSTKAVAVYVEEAKKQMLRELYLSTDIRPDSDVNRLRYNDTGADIIRTAKWGERVVHKAGHYWLNGLGDITEDEMSKIYNNGGILNPRPNDTIGFYLSGNYPFRTNLNIAKINWNQTLQYQSTAHYNNVIRVINLGNNNPQYIGGFRQFGGFVCKAIIPTLHIGALNGTGSGNNTFYSVMFNSHFMYVMFTNIVIDCQIFKNAPLIMYKCLKHLVDKAANASAITITVHATTYGYLTDSSTLPAEHSGVVETAEDIATVTEEELVGMKEWDETTKKYVYATKAEWQQIVTDATAKNISFASA